eukprot:COSAG02_NODE_989_length_15437_cov_95.731860_7_plen_186_part_00
MRTCRTSCWLRTACDAPTAQNLSTPTPSGSQQHSRTLRHHHHRRRRRRASTQHREHRPARERTRNDGTNARGRLARKFDVRPAIHGTYMYQYCMRYATPDCYTGRSCVLYTVQIQCMYSGVCRVLVCAERKQKKLRSATSRGRFDSLSRLREVLHCTYACRILQHSCTSMLECVCTVHVGVEALR